MPRHAPKANRWPVQVRHSGGRPTHVHVIPCSMPSTDGGGCPAELVERSPTNARGGLDEDVLIRRAKKAGWVFGSKGEDPICPDCAALGQALILTRETTDHAEEFAEALSHLSPEELEATRDRIHVQAVLTSGDPDLDAVRDRLAEHREEDEAIRPPFNPAFWGLPPAPAREETMAKDHAAKGGLAPPPSDPTRDQKRRILEELSSLYVSEEVGYSADWTDAKLAAKLSMPEAWVRSLREEFHGENAGNEAGDAAQRARTRELHELRQDIAAVETRLEQALTTGAADIAKLRDRLAKLEAK